MATPRLKINGQWQHMHVSNGEITAAVAAAVAQMQANYDELSMGKIFAFGGPVESIPPKYVPCFGQNLSKTLYAATFNALCPVIDTAATRSGGTITTSVPHGLAVGDAVSIAGGSTHYVATVPNATQFSVLATRTVDPATGQVTISGGYTLGGSVGIVVRRCPHGIADSTNFKAPDRRGVVAIGRDNMGGTDAGRIGWANVPGIIAGVPTADHTHTINDAVSRAALGATSGDAGSLSYVASSVVGGNYPSVTSYGFSHGSWQTHSRGFNHHTPIYGSTNGASNINNMQPSTIAEFIIYTGVE